MLGNVGKLYGKVGNLLKIRNLFTPLRCCKDEDSDISPLFGIFTQPNSKTT